MDNRFECRVLDTWLDYNGHMNLAYYALIFDRAGEHFLASGGLDADRARATGDSWMVAEAHQTFQREALAGEALTVRSRILALDEKRIHLFQRLLRSDERELLATNEQLILHVNLRDRRVCPFADPVASELTKELASREQQAWPTASGRSISFAARRPGREPS